MKIITEQKLQALLMDFDGCASLTTATNPKLNKKHRVSKAPCPYGVVTRTAVRLGLVGGAAAAKELPRGPSVESIAPPIWNGKGERLGVSLCRHTVTGRVYVVFQPSRESIQDNAWVADGEKVEFADLVGYLPASTEDSSPCKFIGLDNIVAMSILNETYVIAR